MNAAKAVFLASIFVFAGLCWALYREVRQPAAEAGPPLVLWCAEALRKPLEIIAQDYERELGQKVELRFGPSQLLLTNLERDKGDLFLPADDSYIDLARQKDLIAEVLPLARMQGVALVRPGLDKLNSWNDLVQPGRKLALANPDGAAVGKLTRAHLQKTGRWDEVLKLQPVFMGNISEVGNAAQLGTVDAGIVFDAVAGSYPKARALHLPELDGIVAMVQVAVAKSSRQPAGALRFARYVAAAERGLETLKKHGYRVVEEADAWAERPELTVYAGAMLRPAIERTLIEFEEREGVLITRVYNGCGILVGGMKTGERPDVYFACDVQFLGQVKDLFDPGAVVSANHLVIAVKKGNPHDVQSLKDLGKPGLKVGVGHEQQCALGQLTKETFTAAGLYGQVAKNVRAQSPTGDLLVVQLRGGGLDAAVVYKSNVTPYAADLDWVAITGIACATAHQPAAVGLATPYPQLARRLRTALQSGTSRGRFEELGFLWEVR